MFGSWKAGNEEWCLLAAIPEAIGAPEVGSEVAFIEYVEDNEPATVERSSRSILLGYLEDSLSFTVLGGVGRARDVELAACGYTELGVEYREEEMADAGDGAAPMLEPPPQY